MGRDDDGRRGVCRLAKLLPPREGRPRRLRLSGADPHAPGARRREHSLADPHQAGGPHSRQHVFHDDAAAPGIGGRRVPRRDHRRGARPGVGAPVQGERGSRQARRAGAGGGSGTRPVHLRGADGEPRGRAARERREPPRRERILPCARHQGDARRDARRGERVVRPAARAGDARPHGRRNPAPDVRPLRRRDDERQEGLAREHRRLAGTPRSVARRARAQPRGRVRGAPHVRRARGARPRGDGHRHPRVHRGGLHPQPHRAGVLPRRATARGRRADRHADRRPCRVHRCGGDAFPSAARPVSGAGARGGAVRRGRRAGDGAGRGERGARPEDGGKPFPAARARAAHDSAPRVHPGPHGRRGRKRPGAVRRA